MSFGAPDPFYDERSRIRAVFEASAVLICVPGSRLPGIGVRDVEIQLQNMTTEGTERLATGP